MVEVDESILGSVNKIISMSFSIKLCVTLMYFSCKYFLRLIVNKLPPPQGPFTILEPMAIFIL